MKPFLLACAIFLGLFRTAGADTFFVANFGVNTVSRYDDAGNASTISSSALIGPTGIVVGPDGNLYVATSGNRIEVFTTAGSYLGTFASVGVNDAMGLAFDRAGNLYAANFAGDTVEKFSPGGISSVFANVIRPTGLAFDAAGNLYVANSANSILRFAPDGTSLGVFASTGLNNPEGLAFDSLGNLYVASNGSGTVVKFSAAGEYKGNVIVGLSGPMGLAFDSSGSLYVVESNLARVTKLTADGVISVFAQTGFNPQYIAVQRPPALGNIATRAQVLAGEKVLDAGFIVVGSGSKQVLIRGLGPSLADSGVPGVLADPVLQLYNSSGDLIAANDNWRDSQEKVITATGLPPTANAEAALVQTLTAGVYTVVESGQNGGTGIGLVELYDLTPGFGAELGNISTRGYVGGGNDVMIAGFIVSAQTGGAGRVYLRALGPSLSSAGVTDPLADPTLELHDGNGSLIATNDNWQESDRTAIEQTGIPPQDAKESALIATLAPGSYTAIEAGKDGGTGVGLVEVYNLK